MSKSRKRKKFIKNRKIQKKIRKMRKTQKKIRKLQRGGAGTTSDTLSLKEGIGVAGKYHIDTLINNACLNPKYDTCIIHKWNHTICL